MAVSTRLLRSRPWARTTPTTRTTRRRSTRRPRITGPGNTTARAPAPVAVVPAVTVPTAHVALIHEARAVSTLDLFSSDRDYLLPFATAPPAAALAPAASFVA